MNFFEVFILSSPKCFRSCLGWLAIRTRRALNQAHALGMPKLIAAGNRRK